jgi:DNA-directed RNA polymerase subunit RPC12/RpoP
MFRNHSAMAKNKGRNAIFNYGICTNTSGKEDGTPCSKCQNKEIQAIRATKEFVCEECGERLIKVPPKPPIPWLKIAIAVLIIAGLATGGYFLFRSCSSSKVQITVVSENETMGAVKGGGKYELNKVITVEATAYDGYRFKSWDDGNTRNSREVLTKENATYTARFEKIKPTDKSPNTPKTITITVRPSDEKMGTVTGGGNFELGKTISIGAIEKEGFKFVSWNDGNKDNPREVITERDETFVANFKKIPVTKPVPTPTQINWRGVATYDGYVKNGQPDGAGGKLTFFRNYQLDLKDVEGTKLDIRVGETIEDTKFENGKLIQGELHRNDGSRRWLPIGR